MIKKILNKVVLVLIGLLLALILLEISMWIAGFTLSSYQKYKNDRALKNKSQYTVMCIGESTTAEKYPIQLQEILNKKYPNKFSIIDCGIEGTTLETILELLNDNITKYKPDITICMMGINNQLYKENKEYISKIKNNKFQNKIKVYRLYILLKEHIKSLIKTKEAFADNINSENTIDYKLQKAINYYNHADYLNAEKILKEILKVTPHYETAYYELFHIYQQKNKDIALEMASKAIDLGFKEKREMYYKIIIDYSIIDRNKELAKKFINKLLNDKNISTETFFSFFYSHTKFLLTKDQKINLFKKISSDKTEKSYRFLAMNYMEQKDYAKADKYFDMAEQLRLNFSSEETNKLYRAIIKKLVDNNIKVICMQYPIRNIESLKSILRDTDYYDKVTFISNKENFKQALKEKLYDEIFRDQFGGDFGHCTEYGNTLIAKNVVTFLIKLVE